MNSDKENENIQPRRQGRRPNALVMSLIQQSKESLQNEKRQQLEATSEYDGEDPLSVYYNNVCWIEQNDPKDVLDKALVKCIRAFDSEKYRQDRRMIKIYIKHFDSSEEPQLCYRELYEKGIGTLVADLYIAWSHYYDVLNNYKEVEAIFLKGFTKGAQPMEELTLAREAFRYSKQQRENKQVSQGDFENQMKERHLALTSLRAYKQPIPSNYANILRVGADSLSCKFCGISFSLKGNCSRHEKSCKKNPNRQILILLCPKCGKSFSRKDNWTKHLKTHSLNKEKSVLDVPELPQDESTQIPASQSIKLPPGHFSFLATEDVQMPATQEKTITEAIPAKNLIKQNVQYMFSICKDSTKGIRVPLAPGPAKLTCEDEFLELLSTPKSKHRYKSSMSESMTGEEQRGMKSSLNNLSIDLSKSEAPTELTQSILDEDLNTVKFNIGLASDKNSTRLNFTSIQEQTMELDLTISISEDEMRRLRIKKIGKQKSETGNIQGAINASNGNPFKNNLREILLESLSFSLCFKQQKNIPKLKPGEKVECNESEFIVMKCIKAGKFASIYTAKDSKNGKVVAMKQENSANRWECYICDQLMYRLKDKRMQPAFMKIEKAIIAQNNGVLVTEFTPFGSIVDVFNKHMKETSHHVDEYVVMVLTTQLLSIVDYLHSCKIIHANLKPNNFMVISTIEVGVIVPAIQLVDFGKAIDMKWYTNGETFNCDGPTENFVCCEMLENKPWTYQIDLFGLAGTVHFMLFNQETMKVRKNLTWDIKQRFPRHINKIIWQQFFHTLLNVRSCDLMPNLQDLNNQIEKMLQSNEKTVLEELGDFNLILLNTRESF